MVPTNSLLTCNSSDCTHTWHLFEAPVCKKIALTQRICNVVFHILTLGIPLVIYHILNLGIPPNIHHPRIFPTKTPSENQNYSDMSSQAIASVLPELEEIQNAKYKEYSDEEKFEMIMGPKIVEIVSNLFLANEQAVGMDNPNALDDLKRKNISHILCCLPESDSQPAGTSERTRFYFPSDFNYTRMPIGDSPNNGDLFIEELEKSISAIERARKVGQGIVVHCNAGSSRSPSVVIGYLMWKYKVSFSQAQNYVSQKRWVQIDNFQNALSDHTHKIQHFQIN